MSWMGLATCSFTKTALNEPQTIPRRMGWRVSSMKTYCGDPKYEALQINNRGDFVTSRLNVLTGLQRYDLLIIARKGSL